MAKAKILIIGTPAHGHINPTLPVVKTLIERGVEVLYYNTEEFHTKISATGAAFHAYPDVGLTSDVFAQAINASLVNVTALLFEKSLTLTGFMVGEIEREQPDVLIFDSICLWGKQAALITGLPSIASITTFVQEGVKVGITWRDLLHLMGGAAVKIPRLLKLRAALVKRYGSLPKGAIFPCTGDLNIVYTARELQPETPFIGENFRFVGPSIAPRVNDTPLALPERHPLVYISLGTLHHNDQSFFETCFEAFADHPGYFVMAAGGAAEHLTAPSNFMVRAHVPQLQVLEQADLFITHAGMNSLHESLYYGVPMVFVPRQMEQTMNARIAQMRGVGVVLGDQPPYGTGISASMLREAVDHVLADPQYRTAAQKLQQVLRQTGGTQQAVEEILQFTDKHTREFTAPSPLRP